MQLWAGSADMPKLTGGDAGVAAAADDAQLATTGGADKGTDAQHQLSARAPSSDTAERTLVKANDATVNGVKEDQADSGAANDLVVPLPGSSTDAKTSSNFIDAAVLSSQTFCLKAYPEMHAAHLNGTNPDSFSMVIPQIRFGHSVLATSDPSEKAPPAFTMHIYNVGLNPPSQPPTEEEATTETDDAPAPQDVPTMDRKSAAILTSAVQLKRRNPGGSAGYLESHATAQILLGLERRYKELLKVEPKATREDIVFVDVGGGMGWFGLVALSRGFSLLAVEPLESNIHLLQSSLCANLESDFLARSAIVSAAAADSTVYGKKCTIRSRDSNLGGAIVCRSSSLASSDDSLLADREESATQKQLATVAGNRPRGVVPMTTLDDVVQSYLNSQAGLSPRLKSGRKSIGVVRISAKGEEPFVVSGGFTVLQLSQASTASSSRFRNKPPLVVLSYNPRKLGGEMPARAMLSRFIEVGYVARTEGFASAKEAPRRPMSNGEAVIEDLVKRHRATVKNVYLERP